MAIENEVDILLLQETWLRKSDTALITQIQEYKFDIVQVRKNRKIDIGGGVAIVYNSNLKMKQLRTENFSSFEVVVSALEAEAEKILFLFCTIQVNQPNTNTRILNFCQSYQTFSVHSV